MISKLLKINRLLIVELSTFSSLGVSKGMIDVSIPWDVIIATLLSY